MILLTGQSLTPKRKVPLGAMSLTIKERDSTAQITPADMTGINVNSWLQDDTEPGKGIVWRVASIQMAWATNTLTVKLEHVINTLRDRILFGEVTPKTITGNSGATTCTAKQAINYILGKQSVWTLGTFEGSNPSNAYKFDGDDLYSALETVTETLTDVYWDYDLTALPFKLHIRQLKDGDDSELRPGRNLVTISRTIDKSGMFTRFYPIGENDLHLGGGGYVSKNEGTYGVIEKSDTDNSRSSTGELTSWANIQLGLHAEPTVTIDVEGLELSDATGESMDRFTLMRICRVPLEEYGTTVKARIVAKTYPDKLRSKKRVKLTLSNSRNEVTRILANVIQRSGKGARSSTRKDKKDLAWFEDTNEHVAMCAKGIIGVDEKGNPNWERLSQLVVNGEGITGTVTELVNGQKAAETRFEQAEKKIGMVVGEYDEGGTYVKAGEIVLAINEAGESEARIDANKVYIGNNKSTTVIAGKCQLSDVTADYIAGRIATLSVLNVAAVSSSGNITISNGAMTAPTYYIGSGNSLRNMASGIWALRLQSSNGNYTLQKQDWDDTDWVDVGTFKRATSLSGAWSSGRVDVTANDSSVPAWWRLLEDGDPEWAADYKSVQVPVWARYGNGSTQRETTGWNVYVNTSRAWQEGYDANHSAQGVTVDSVTAPVIGGNTVKSSDIEITATASNGANLVSHWKLEEGTFATSGTPCVVLKDLSRTANQVVGRIAALDAIDYGKAQMTGGAITGTPISGSTWSYLDISLTGKIGSQTVATGKLSLDRQVAGGEHCVVANVAGDTIARISTESVYNDGRNAVGISGASWDNNGAAYGSYQGGRVWTPTSRSVKVSTTGRPTNPETTVWIGIDAGSWNNGKKTVYLYKDNWNGTRMAGVEVDIGGWDFSNMGLSSSKYTNIQKTYTVNANYRYALFSVTVAGVKKRIMLEMIK